MMQDVPDSLPSDSVLNRKIPDCAISANVIIPNGLHLLKRQFVVPVSFSASYCSAVSLFEYFVVRIVLGIANPKMGGIDAPSAISIWAIVKNAFAVGNFTKVQNPTGAMGQNHSVTASEVSTSSTPSNESVPVWHPVPGPQPTGFRVLNFGKESFREGVRKSLIEVIPACNLLHRQFVCGCGLLAPAASSL